MAGDWIKMRVWLARDPRVIRMADYLASQREFMDWLTDPVRRTCNTSAYEHVTRNVTASLCVTGLLVTWGTAREQGDRDGDDLVVRHCDKNTIDAVADIPCFGDAMEFVEWLVDNDDGVITFPKFFKENESPEEKHKRQNAERQARYREKKAAESNVTDNATSNATVTTEKRRGEKRRGEEKDNGAVAPASKRFTPPTLSELITEFTGKVRNPQAEAMKFLGYYESNGWKVGRNPMKSWKSAVAGWATRSNENAGHQRTVRPSLSERAEQAADEAFGPPPTLGRILEGDFDHVDPHGPAQQSDSGDVPHLGGMPAGLL